MAEKSISIGVCGRFHYHNYVRYLAARGVLRHITFSHRLSTLRELPKECRSNIFVKEYLLGLHQLIVGRCGITLFLPLYNGVWRILSPIAFRPADVNLFLLHGNCLRLIRKAKAAGKIVVGEAVNAHPICLQRLLQEEARTIGLKRRIPGASRAQLREIALIDYLLCPSSAVQDSYLAMGFDRSRTMVIPYGCDLVDARSFQDADQGRELKSRSPSDCKKIVCVAQVTMRKGIHHLLDCLISQQTADKPGFDLTLIGSADPDYLLYLRSKNLQFTHVPHIPNDELKKRLRDFDVFVLPSIEDGFAIAVTEALEQGLPVVVSKFAGASEVVSKCGGGFVIDPRDRRAMLQAIVSCAEGKFPAFSGKVNSWKEYADQLAAMLMALPKLPERSLAEES